MDRLVLLGAVGVYVAVLAVGLLADWLAQREQDVD